MIENLSDDLSRLIAVYKNRLGMFHWNGRVPTFSLRDVVRHHLFTRAESCGLTPIPSVKVLQWEIDLICLHGLKPVYMFHVRDSKRQDWRQLLLFPSSIKRVLVAVYNSMVPEDTKDLTVIRINKKPTREIELGPSVMQVIAAYQEAFVEVYGTQSVYPKGQLVGPATRMTNFWRSFALDVNFKSYCVWFFKLKRIQATPGHETFVHLKDMIDRAAVMTFKTENSTKDYDGDWTSQGW